MRAIRITRRVARRLLLRRAELLVETSVVFYHIARLAGCCANFPVAAALRSAPLSQVMQYNTFRPRPVNAYSSSLVRQKYMHGKCTQHNIALC